MLNLPRFVLTVVVVVVVVCCSCFLPYCGLLRNVGAIELAVLVFAVSLYTVEVLLLG